MTGIHNVHAMSETTLCFLFLLIFIHKRQLYHKAVDTENKRLYLRLTSPELNSQTVSHIKK